MENKKIRPSYFQYGAYSTLFVVVILGFLTLFNYLSTKVFFRLDLTEGREYSVTKATKTTLKQLDDIVNVKVFFSKKLPSQLVSTVSQVKDILEEYRAYSGGKLRVKYLDPAEDPANEREAQSLGIQPVRMDAIEKDQRQILTGYLGIAVQYAGKTELIPVVTDVKDFEYSLTSIIKKMRRKKDLSLGVLTGNKETPLDSQCTQVYEQMKKQYQIRKVEVREGSPIDSTLDALLIMGPENVPERTLFEIDQYVMHGGKLIAMIDGVGIGFEGALRGSPKNLDFDELLGYYGARIKQDLVLDPACGIASFQTQVAPGYFSYFSTPYPFWPKVLRTNVNESSPVVNKLAGLMFPWTSSVDITIDSTEKVRTVKPLVLVRSSKQSWTMHGSFMLDPQQQFNPPPGEQKQYDLAVVLHGKFLSPYKGKTPPKFKVKVKQKDGSEVMVDTLNSWDNMRTTLTQSPETRVLVTGCSRVGTDQFVQMTGGINLNFMLNIVDWMVSDEDLITIRSRKVIDRPVKELTAAKRSAIKWANLVVMPIALIIFGLVLVFVRRKGQKTGAPATKTETSTLEGAGK